MGNHFMFKER